MKLEGTEKLCFRKLGPLNPGMSPKISFREGAGQPSPNRPLMILGIAGDTIA
jgi:hypothetical protein